MSQGIEGRKFALRSQLVKDMQEAGTITKCRYTVTIHRLGKDGKSVVAETEPPKGFHYRNSADVAVKALALKYGYRFDGMSYHGYGRYDAVLYVAGIHRIQIHDAKERQRVLEAKQSLHDLDKGV